MSIKPSSFNNYPKHHIQAKRTPFWGRVKKWLLSFILLFMLLSVGICELLRWLPPSTTMFMLYRHAEDAVYDHRVKPMSFKWVAKDKIAKNAFVAVIASEDQRFFQHHGFDFQAIGAAIDVYMDGGSLRGASTLSQQVAKNVFLLPSKSFLRKGLEVWFTVLIEALWGKQRILEVYLNIAEFGDHIFGIEAASQRYFGISAQRLNAQQAALLAATLPNPIVLRTLHPSVQVIRRQQWILRQMPNILLAEH